MSFIAALLYAMSSSVLLAILLAFMHGGLSPTIASISLTAGTLVAAFSIWRDHRNRDSERRTLNDWEWGVIAIFILFALRAFLWLVFIDGDEIKVLSPNNLGDLSLHLTYIYQMVSGTPFWPESPILSGTKLNYPLGMDLFNALLLLIGADPLKSLIWVGLIACVLTGMALWRWGGAFTLAGFLFNGGLAGFVFFRTGELLDYQAELAWKSLPLTLFVTERGLLFALPAGLLLLWSWRARFFGTERKAAWTLPQWGEWLLYASMPVFHLHTFLFLSIVLFAWSVARQDLRPALKRSVGPALVPAAVLVLLVTDFFRGPSTIGWQVGWMQSDPDFLSMVREQFDMETRLFTVPFFWILNFGILPLLVVWLLIRIVRDPAKQWERAITIPAVGMFLLCCLIRFAPWEWDNTKLMIWSYLAVLPLLWREIFLQWPMWLRVVGCFALFWSGFISLLGGLDSSHRGFPIATCSEIELIAPSLSRIPVVERFIAQPSNNHPLLLLGRPLVLGYGGHVRNHGHDWQEKQARVEAILNGENGWRNLALQSGAHYLFWGTREREAYPNSTQPWRAQMPVVAHGEWGEIYELYPTDQLK